ncbi:MAG: hypothetical protein MJZ70_04340, partial [Bacteroidales bacterium]|nr:hypothetical protein [Bacteroidales bacterium]
MKKQFLFVIAVMIGICQLQAQTHRVISNNAESLTMAVATGELQVNDLTIAGNVYSQITMEGMTNTVKNVGEPELPMLVKTIEIPMCSDIHVTATAGSVRSMTAFEAGIRHTVLPTQPQYHKSYMGDRDFVKDDAIYGTNANYGMPLATVAKAGIARNINLANIFI